MKVLFIGGVFAKENESEIITNTKTCAEFSANIFQKKLISGFEENNIEVKVLSAPLIGSYPNAYNKIYFSGFENKQDNYQYVNFLNIWGVRNFSRAHSLKKEIRKLHKTDEYFDLIVVYSAHTPFLEAGIYAKKLFKNSKICYVVPDLPQYMNLNESRSIFYDFFKKYDIIKMNKLSKNVDSFIILTEPMKEVLRIGNRPYKVVEGIIESVISSRHIDKNDEKFIVYTGKLNEKFGIKTLVDAFCLIRDKSAKLVLCGDGDAKEYILEKAKNNERIIFKGQISAQEAKTWISKASVLVNPRPNNEEYTKYSFPSKNIEYLASGNPVVAYMLDGMPEIYKEFIVVPEEFSPQSLANAIIFALNADYNNSKFLDYSNKKLCSENIVKVMVDLL